MAQTITGIVAWLKNWFYDKTQIDGFVGTLTTNINNKVDSQQSTANYNVVTGSTGAITIEPKINVASGSGLSLDASTKALSHGNSITAQTAVGARKFSFDNHGHITGGAVLYGSDINLSSSDSTNISSKISSIESDISNLQNVKVVEIVTTLPSASADTMGKLYIISETENSVAKVNVYYTKATTSGSTTTYAWQKMDTDILDSLVVDWTDIQNKPNLALSSHVHGDITSLGKIDSSSSVQAVNGDDYPLIADNSQGDKIQKGYVATSKLKDLNSHNYTNISSSLQDGATQANLNSHINTALGNKAPKDHSTTSTTYGVATSTKYGHVKIADNLNESSFSSSAPVALSAKQGYDLNEAISDRVTSIALVPYADDNTGAITLYYGDEPSSS